MKLKKDISQYNENEIEILYSFVMLPNKNSKNLKEKKNILNNSIKTCIIKDTHNLTDINFLLNSVDYLYNIIIDNGKFNDVIFNFKNLKIKHQLNINNSNINSTFNNFLKSNDINEIIINTSSFNLTELYTYNLSSLYINDSCNIEKLEFIDSENLEKLSIIDNSSKIKNRTILWNNKNKKEMKIFSSVGTLIKNLNPMDFVKYIYIEVLENNNININNIKAAEQVIINKVISKYIDISSIEYDLLDIEDSNINELLVNINKFFNFSFVNSSVNLLNKPSLFDNKAFVKYYSKILKLLKEKSNIDEKTEYQYLKYIKKYFKEYEKYSKQFENIEKNSIIS